MTRSFLSLGGLIFVLTATFGMSAGCTDQGEGQPCGVPSQTAGNDFSQFSSQCSTGLACVAKTIAGESRGVCCPTAGTSSEAVCGSATSTLLEAGALDGSPVDATSGDASSGDATDTGPTTDTGAADTSTHDAADANATDSGTDGSL